MSVAGPIPFRPRLPRADVRTAAAVVCALLAFLAATGVVADAAFSQVGAAKYLLTVAAPLALGVLVLAREPTTTVTLGVLFLLPVAGLSASFGPIETKLVLPLCIGALGLRAFTRSPRMHLTPAVVTTGLALLLLVEPFVAGDAWIDAAEALFTLIAVAILVGGAVREGHSHLVAWVFVAAASIQSVVALGEAITGTHPSLYGGTQSFGSDYFFAFDGINRPFGTFTDPISLGNMLALSLPLCLFLIVRGPAMRWERLLAAGLTLLIGSALVVTLSRMSWIGASAGLAIAALLLPGRLRPLTIAGLAAGGLAVVTLGSVVTGDAITTRFTSILAPTSIDALTQRGDELRQLIFEDAVNVFQANPLSGVGMGDLTPALVAQTPEITLAGHAHSVYLSMLGQAGVLGGASLLVVLLASFAALWLGRRHDPVLVAVSAGAMVAMLVVWSTDYTVRYPDVAGLFGVVFGLAASAGRSGTARLDVEERR